MDASGVDGLDGVRRHFDTDDLLPARRKQRGGGQTDITEADHGNAVEHRGFRCVNYQCTAEDEYARLRSKRSEH